MKWVRVILLLLVFSVISGLPAEVVAANGINRTINFQGKVVNKSIGVTDGTNITDGSYDFVFGLYTAASGSTPVWTETWNSGTTQVVVSDGIFNVALGTYATFPSTVDFNSDSLYLTVNFNDDGDMTPRIRFTAVPYALNAEKVAGLTVTNTTGTLTIPDGTVVTLDQSLATTDSPIFAGISIGGSVTFSGVAVGTGTTVLYVGAGGVLTQGTLPPSGTASTTNGLSLIGGSVGLGGTLTQNTNIGTSSFGLSFFGLGNSQALFIESSGYVGIGTTDPAYVLDIYSNQNGSGYMNIANPNDGNLANAGYYFSSNAASGGFSATSSNYGTGGVGYENLTGRIVLGAITGGGFDIASAQAGSDVRFYTAGLTAGYERMRLNSSGNLGVGTTNPLYRLDVSGNLNLTGTILAAGTSGASGKVLSSTVTGLSWIDAGGVGTTYTFINGLSTIGGPIGLGGTLTQNTNIGTSSFGLSFLGLGNSQALYVGSNGYVGVGNTNPQYLLDLAGNLNMTGTIYASGTTGASGQVLSSTGIGLSWTTVGGATYYANNGLSMAGTTVGLGGTLSQNTNVGTSSFGLSFLGLGNSQALFIESTGYVGIGTTDPAYKLDVLGAVNFSGALNVGGSLTFTGVPVGTGTTVLYIASDGKLVQGTLPPGGSASATNGLSLVSSSVGLGGTLTQNTNIGTSSFSFSILGLGNSQAFYVGSNGYVGIGTTNPTRSLEIASNLADYSAYVYNSSTAAAGAGMYARSDGNGNMLTLNNNGSDYLTVSPYQTDFNNPVDFSGSGDVGIAYDLYFTNQTSSSIKSYGPLTLESGEEFESNDLTLRSFNAGNIVFDIGATGKMMIGTGVGKTYPSLFVVDGGSTDPTGTNGALYYSTASNKLRCYENGVWTDCIGSSTGTYSSKIILSPEYSGASFTKDGSTTNDGSMTSDNNLNVGTSGWKNYYEWSSTNAALQDYSILVRVTLPGDFDSWETGSCPGATCAMEFNYQTGVGTTGDNYVSLQVNSDADNFGTAICTIGSTASTGWSSSGCTDAVLNDGSAPEWDAAGETVVIRIKMAAKNTASALARAGDIVLRYKAR